MATTITYTNCPVCGSASVQKVLVAQDYTVSNELFEIWQCEDCTLRFTQYIPDAAGIGKYYQSENYISHSDSDAGLINKLYKTARRYTLAQKRKLVIKSTGLLSGKLLDVGCGTGAFLNEMKLARWQVTGLEPDAGAREKAKKLYNIEPLASETLFNLDAGQFNAITLWHVLEHVHELHGYFSQFRQLLAPNGKLFIAVPNYTSADGAHYGEYWAAYDVPRHLYHFSPQSMETLASKHGFRIIETRPMLLDAYYIAMLSEQYKNGSGNLLGAVWQGLQATLATVGNGKKSSSLIYILQAL